MHEKNRYAKESVCERIGKRGQRNRHCSEEKILGPLFEQWAKHRCVQNVFAAKKRSVLNWALLDLHVKPTKRFAKEGENSNRVLGEGEGMVYPNVTL